MSNTTDLPLTLLSDVAADAARSAGAALLEQLGRERQIEYKGTINLVTDADLRSEAMIVSHLLARFPNHQVLAEEGTRLDGPSEYRWIVDPLDGTTNFAHAYPHFAVSIGLELQGRLVVGVVFDPTRDELFTARDGGGAWLNGKPIGVSRTGSLIHSLLCTGFPYDRTQFDPTLRRWESVVRRAQAVRRDGSAALDLCYVAAGRFDGFWENHLYPWDAAAGMLIVAEAGGTLSDFLGGPPDLYSGELVATNGLIHAEMLDVLAETRTTQYTPANTAGIAGE